MLKIQLFIGSILVVVLLTLVSFSSVVGYSSVKSNPSNTIIPDEYDNATPIVLVLQLITKLRNHKDIQNVETEDDVLRIIEGDEELNSIIEQLSVEDCGCEEETTEWGFPIICLFFGFIDAILFIIWTMTGGHFYIAELVLSTINEIFNCNWA